MHFIFSVTPSKTLRRFACCPLDPLLILHALKNLYACKLTGLQLCDQLKKENTQLCIQQEADFPWLIFTLIWHEEKWYLL